MGSTYTFTCNLPPSTTASLARKIDLGLLDSDNIVSKPDRRESDAVQRFIREYVASKKSI